MTYGAEMELPEQPTPRDVKDLRRQVAHDRFGVVDGGTPAGARGVIRRELPRHVRRVRGRSR